LVEANFNRAGAETIDHSPSVLTGDQFDLAIEAHQIDFTGRRVKAVAVNGQPLFVSPIIQAV
jgi:hypothetical protein